jgi:hypothetical protein
MVEKSNDILYVKSLEGIIYSRQHGTWGEYDILQDDHYNEGLIHSDIIFLMLCHY